MKTFKIYSPDNKRNLAAQLIVHIDYLHYRLNDDGTTKQVCRALCGERVLTVKEDVIKSFNSVFLHSIPRLKSGFRDVSFLDLKYKESVFCEECLEKIRYTQY